MSIITKDSSNNLNPLLSPKNENLPKDKYSSDNFIEEPAMSPLQKRRLEETRSSTSNKKQEESDL